MSLANSADNTEMGRLLAAIGCVVGERSVIYVSTPLTTGIRWAEWSGVPGALKPDDPEYGHELKTAVVGPNRENARQFVHALRVRTPSPVVDPSALPDVPGWSQPDYRAFWAQVIQRYAHTVVFMDGWEYSHGCTYEYLVAVRSGAQTLNQDMAKITLSGAISLIGAAIQEFLKRAQPVDFLEEIVGGIESELATEQGAEA